MDESRPKGASIAAEGVSVSFDGVQALRDVGLEVSEGEIVGLIGPNGAGKTTLVNVLSGFQRPDRGSVRLGGRDVTGWRTRRLVRYGLVRTFQGARPFSHLSVRDNVTVAALGAGASRRVASERTAAALTQFGLEKRAGDAAGSLPLGEERLLGLARAVVAEPKFILVDEPAAGLGEQDCARLVARLRATRARQGCGMLVIDHEMDVIMRLCDRVHVLDGGQTIRVGTPGEVQSDPRVREAYLGAVADA